MDGKNRAYAKKKSLIFILAAIVLMTGCSEQNKPVTGDDESLSGETYNISENETVISLSPDEKYRAEAYGTRTDVTAGGIFPYEGIRIINTESDEVIWETNPGYYQVNFLWSPDSRYLGIYYVARIWGDSIVVDVTEKKTVSLPALEDIALLFDEDVRPQEDRPDPYFEITGWEDSETVVVDFRWSVKDGQQFSGRFNFNVKTGEVSLRQE